jgi:hypothetical protein
VAFTAAFFLFSYSDVLRVTSRPLDFLENGRIAFFRPREITTSESESMMIPWIFEKGIWILTPTSFTSDLYRFEGSDCSS